MMRGKISLKRTVNLGNYESADVLIMMDVDTDTTEQEMDEFLEGPFALGFSKVKDAVNRRVATIRKEVADQKAAEAETQARIREAERLERQAQREREKQDAEGRKG